MLLKQSRKRQKIEIEKTECCNPLGVSRHTRRFKDVYEMNVQLKYKSALVPLTGKICSWCKTLFLAFLSEDEYARPGVNI